MLAALPAGGHSGFVERRVHWGITIFSQLASYLTCFLSVAKWHDETYCCHHIRSCILNKRPLPVWVIGRVDYSSTQACMSMLS
ncbi:hypothetical protein AMD24_00670 [Candidatus Xiphinematobacter sp. Idaho Grape]|nr:hypothetical protein AMD24_00670 [Candidatus Xiphinematobacter sp. Idaho Grape]